MKRTTYSTYPRSSLTDNDWTKLSGTHLSTNILVSWLFLLKDQLFDLVSLNCSCLPAVSY